MKAEKNAEAGTETKADTQAQVPQEDGTSEKLEKAKRTRGAKTPRDPDVYFLNTVQVGKILGVREDDARFLMDSGAIHSYMHRSMLKTTRTDVDKFIEGLREGSLDIPGLLIVHDNTRARMIAREAAAERQRKIEADKLDAQKKEDDKKKQERLKKLEELKKLDERRKHDEQKRLEDQRMLEDQKRLDELKMLHQHNSAPSVALVYILCQPTPDQQFIDAQIQSQQNPNS